ncbi:DUF4157 domain-containing protein [Undibacterium sp. CY18W]|uniref:DUF4157 domain-containing protein n=2 Tax=Undibacterium hunanense TaxID=2762292 RepID=A0ABR6ZT70_9BURK|nr:DUF4157 domain-containing protein [Undibacterium hunanense]
MMNNSPQAQHMQAIQRMADQSAQSHRLGTATGNAPLQRMAEAAPVQREVQVAAPKPNNTGLPDNLKSGIEGLSGHSLDDVKVHYNSPQPAQLQAHAYAQGTDIHLAPGQEQHLPHEAWHVVQQKQGRVRPTFQMKAGVQVNDDAGLESEADMMGSKALSLDTAQLARDSQTAHGRESVEGRDPVQRKLMSQTGGSKVVQALADTKLVDRPLLAHIAEEKTHLKQWAAGEFYAWELDQHSKNECHAHLFKPELKPAEVKFKGHVVTGKSGELRNQTPHEIKAVMAKPDDWTTTVTVGAPLKQIETGTLVELKDHDDYAERIRGTLRDAVAVMMNSPESNLESSIAEAKKIAEGFKKEKKDKNATGSVVKETEWADDFSLGTAFE